MGALDQILYWASVNYHPLYEQYLVEEYEKDHGPHFNEETAKKAVEAMFSYDEDNVKHKGEHWTVEQVRSAMEPFKDLKGEQDTCWDAYVACNMWWHDLGDNYRRHNAEHADYCMIEDAITWAFDDPDAVDGKIWRYFHM